MATATSPHPLPAALAAHTVESLYAEHGPQRPWVYWLAILTVVSALAALPLVKVDVTVRAPGMVRPATERSELRIPVSAQIAEVLARDNDHVTVGQPLLILRSRDLEERLSLNRTRQRDKSALVADLQQLTFESSPPPPSALSASCALKNSDASVSATPSATPSTSTITPAPTPTLGLQTPELRADFAQHQAQLATHALNLAKAARELARHETLATKGLITARELDQARDDLAAATAEQSTHLRTTHTRWATRLRDEQSGLDTLLTEENRLAEESHQTTVRAPVTGSVQGLTGLAPGAWLAAGQSVGTVSPDDRLLIETFVPSRDVGLLRPGQAVHLQIDAYSYTQWGVLAGTVTAIAEDSGASSAAAGSTVYKVTILPAATALHLANGTTGTLRKGMTLSARFVVARRSVLQILYEDASAWLNPLEHTVTDRSSTTISSAFR